jgi:hypothetical protein
VRGGDVDKQDGPGKIALEEHVLLDREDHIDRWRTLVPMIPEQFLPPIVTRLTDTLAFAE